MKKPIELPPMLAGEPEEQIRQLRDYLIRVILQLNEEDNNA